MRKGNSKEITIAVPHGMYKKVSIFDILVYATVKKYYDIKRRKPCFPSYETIGKTMRWAEGKTRGSGRYTISKSVQKLRDKGYLTISSNGRNLFYSFPKLFNRYETITSTFVLDTKEFKLEYMEKAYLIVALEYMDFSIKDKGVLNRSIDEMALLLGMKSKEIKKIEDSLRAKGYITDSDTKEGRVFDLGTLHLYPKCSRKQTSKTEDKKTKQEMLLIIKKNYKAANENQILFERELDKIDFDNGVRYMTKEESKGKKRSIKISIPNGMYKKVDMTDILVYAVIKCYRDKETGRCHITPQGISKMLGYKKEDVEKSINTLTKNEYISLITENGCDCYVLPFLKEEFEIIDSRFLFNKDLSNQEKAYIIASKEGMFEHSMNFGITSYNKQKRAERCNMKMWQIDKIEESLMRKGYLTFLEIRPIKFNKITTDTGELLKWERVNALRAECVFHLDRLNLTRGEEKKVVSLDSSLKEIGKEMIRSFKVLEDSQQTLKIAERHYTKYKRTEVEYKEAC